jgi:hypothetical protein
MTVMYFLINIHINKVVNPVSDWVLKSTPTGWGWIHESGWEAFWKHPEISFVGKWAPLK